MPTTTQVPSHTSYPPDSIIILALKHPERINLNRRRPHWPEKIKKAYTVNSMFPPFAQFLSQLKAGTKVVICYQDDEGGIMTLADTVKEVLWTGKGDDTRKGDYATIWFDNKNCPGEHISLWGNFVLAVGNIGRLPPDDARCRRDPNGTHFVQMFEQCGA